MKVFKTNYLYLYIYILVLLLVIPKYGILTRYPWQDLIYADFQIFNRWRWFAESLNQTGLIDTLTSNTDFRMNTGENLYLSSRVSAPIFDVGAWLYFITGSLDFAFFSKYLILTLFSAVGLTGLIERSTSIMRIIPRTKFLVFAITLASMMGHPLLMHEVGPMVLWYLFLTPCWILLFLDIRDHGITSMLLNWKTYVFILLTIGSSDLFVFFYFPLFLILAVTEKSNTYTSIKNIFKGIMVLEFALGVSKILYLYYSIYGGNISNSGSWDLVDYLENFVIPLFLSLFLPFFWGPVIIFLNFIVLGLIVYFGLQSKSILKKYTIILFAMLLVLLTVGILLHANPLTREALPSAFRYHVAPWSIFVISMIPIFINEVLKKTNKPPSLEKYKKTIMLLVLIVILSLSNIEQFYSSVVSAGSKRIVDRDIRQWITTDLPNCIKGATSNTKNSEKVSQYVFLTANDEDGRNDNLTSLIENPWALEGRTFNQWRYGTAKSNFLLLEKYGLKGINTWAFTENDLKKAIEYANTLGISSLVSTTPLASSEKIKFLKECRIPENVFPKFVPFKQLLSGIETGNTSYQKNVFVYEIFLEWNPIHMTEVNSNTVEYNILCDEKKTYTLPSNYTSDLRITNYESAQLTRELGLNLTTLKIKSCTAKLINIEIKSQNKILYLDVFFWILYISMSIYLAFRGNRKSKKIN